MERNSLSGSTVIGIDVGYSPTRRSSAICRLDWSDLEVSWEIARFRAVEPERETTIRRVVGARSIVAAAFDGPLRQGFDVIGRYRTAEGVLTRQLWRLIGKPGQSSSPSGKRLNAHANVCVGHILTHAQLHPAAHGVAIDDKAIVEAFPSSFLGMMIAEPSRLTARRGDRSDMFFQHLVSEGVLSSLVSHCLPGRRLTQELAQVINHDDRAALVCALSALCVAQGDFVAVGDSDGWIILPPRQFIQPAQWALLQQNANEVSDTALHISVNRHD